LTDFICLWCNARIVAIEEKCGSTICFPLWRNNGRSSAAAISRRHKKLRNHWYQTATTVELALLQIVSFSRHLCSRHDARVDQPMPKERLLRKITRKIKIDLRCTKPVIPKTGRKSNLQRSHQRYSPQHRSIELHSCISSESRQFFKRIFYLKQINVITGTPRIGEPGAIVPVAPLNPALLTSVWRRCSNYETIFSHSVLNSLDVMTWLLTSLTVFTTLSSTFFNSAVSLQRNAPDGCAKSKQHFFGAAFLFLELHQDEARPRKLMQHRNSFLKFSFPI